MPRYTSRVKLGTRITLSTASLVAVALGVYGYASVRIRHGELAADLERQTQSLGDALQVAVEAAQTSTRHVQQADVILHKDCLCDAIAGNLKAALESEDVSSLVAKVREREKTLRVDVFELPASKPPVAVDDEDPPPPDPTRESRLRRVQITDQPYGEHVEIAGAPVFAYAVPLRDESQTVIAAIDLVRDESGIQADLRESARDVTITVVLVGAVLALLVWAATRGGLTEPLKRLVVGIDEVSHGDLTRVILRERDDEIGDLAERFNEMTTSLREARDETQRGVEAKLALEARLRHSEKLATIGQLAAGIAHEVGTPLNVIGGRARALEKKAIAHGDGDGAPTVDPAEVAKNASIIAAQAARITRIIQQLLDYARKKVAERGPVDLTRVVRDSVDFLEHQLQAQQVTVEVRPFARDADDTPEGPTVVGDADQLQQVCLNLCINAIQAMPSGGSMQIAIRGVSRRKPGLDMAPPGRYVVVEVADSGVGIPEADRERIFEPFYSTKQDGGGTGLGLAVAHGIVKDHDGWIEIEGRPEGGTIFRVFLPAEPEAESDQLMSTHGTN